MDIQNSAFTIKLKLCFVLLGIRIDDCCVVYFTPVCLEQVAKDTFLVKLSILICNFGQ
jgi:hypothetical protein